MMMGFYCDWRQHKRAHIKARARAPAQHQAHANAQRPSPPNTSRLGFGIAGLFKNRSSRIVIHVELAAVVVSSSSSTPSTFFDKKLNSAHNREPLVYSQQINQNYM
jgi:hypothetical protein